MKKRISALISDHLRQSVSAIVTFFALFSASAAAEVDLQLGGIARSFPLSGYAFVQSGYGQLLWGETSGVLYGYVRPYIEVDSAGTYQAGLAGFEVFPVSFLGARGGGEWNQNDSHYHDYQCPTGVNCEGTMYRKFVEGQLVLGLADWFASVWLRWEHWSHKNPELGDFMDPNTGLIAYQGGDSEMVARFFTGYNITPEWAVIASGNYNQMIHHFGIVRFGMLGARYRQGDFNAMVGLSHYQATEQKGGYGVFAGFTWSILPSVGLK